MLPAGLCAAAACEAEHDLAILSANTLWRRIGEALCSPSKAAAAAVGQRHLQQLAPGPPAHPATHPASSERSLPKTLPCPLQRLPLPSHPPPPPVLVELLAMPMAWPVGTTVRAASLGMLLAQAYGSQAQQEVVFVLPAMAVMLAQCHGAFQCWCSFVEH